MKFKEEVRDRLGKIDNHLGIYNEQLTEHIKRTNKLEEVVKPLAESHNFWKKFFGYGTSIIASAAATATVIHFLGK